MLLVDGTSGAIKFTRRVSAGVSTFASMATATAVAGASNLSARPAAVIAAEAVEEAETTDLPTVKAPLGVAEETETSAPPATMSCCNCSNSRMASTAAAAAVATETQVCPLSMYRFYSQVFATSVPSGSQCIVSNGCESAINSS